MQSLLENTAFTRSLPTWVRYAVTTGLVVIAFLLRFLFEVPVGAYPFLLFFPVIIASAALFDHGSGVYATIVSAVLTAWAFVPPPYSFAVKDPNHVLALAIFIGIGLATASLIEVMHNLLKRLMTSNLALLAANERLQAIEGEKDFLIQEMSHRTKNHLQTLASLILLQRKATDDPVAQRALTAAAERAHVLGRVHDRLNLVDSGLVVDLRTFLGDLCQDLSASLALLRPIAVRVEIESHTRPMEQAVSLGLILNELLTNALKYAFPDDREGVITVRLFRRGADLCLMVADDGIGLPDGDGMRAGGMGQRLVRSLTQQLGGTITMGTGEGGGTRCEICFPA